MELDNPHAEAIVAHLEALNRQVARQNSFARMFVVGIFYGIGFVVGSVLIASVILGFLAPYLGQIPWVQNAYKAGATLIHGGQ